MKTNLFTKLNKRHKDDDPWCLTDREVRRIRTSLNKALDDEDPVPPRFAAMRLEEAVEALDIAHEELRSDDADAATYLTKDILAACREFLEGDTGNAINSHYLIAHAIIAARSIKAGQAD